MNLFRRFIAAALALALVSCASAPPRPPKVVNVIVFPGGFNWPNWVAQEKGLFARNGIEVKLTPTPSSVFQLTNLIDGKFDIAINATDVLGRYQGLVGGARKAWAEQNRDAVVGFIRAYSDAIDWLYDPKNKDEAIAIFLKYFPSANAQAALTAYGVLLSPTDGFQKKARIDAEGVKTVLQLRSKYGQPKKVLTDASRYYDLSFYDAAMRR